METIGRYLTTEAVKGPTPKAERPVDDVAAEQTAKMESLGFEFDRQSSAMLVKYIEAIRSGCGLLVTGPVGVGKSAFFGIRGVPVLSMLDAVKHPIHEISAALESYGKTGIFVDDIGAEPVFNNYGTKMEILPTILEARLRTKAVTSFTTNLSVEELHERYGARVFDRICSLARLVRLDGGSKRRPGGLKVSYRSVLDPVAWRSCAVACKFYDESSAVCTKGVRREPSATGRCPYYNGTAR